MMPAAGSARTTRLVRDVPLTGLPAQAALLTKTMNAIVPAQTSRFDHRCDTPDPLRDQADLALTVVFLGGVDRQLQRLLVVVPVELPGLHPLHPHNLPLPPLHPPPPSPPP